MKHLFPYKQTKTKSFFREGNRKAIIEVNGKKVIWGGDKFKDRILSIPMDETVHLDDYVISYKK